MNGRLKKLMDQEGLPFDDSRSMTFNSRQAQELAKWAEFSTLSELLNMALYQAYFVDGRNVGQTDVLLDIVEEVGLPRDEARKVLENNLMKEALDADWNHARRIGVTSIPTFAVGLTAVAGAQPYGQLARLVEQAGASKRI